MTRPTILIADDEPQIRQALRQRLEALAYRVVECSDGLGVLTKTRTQRVDALILDHEMPLGEGRVIAHSIRSYSGAPIIFLSGHSPSEFRDAVMRLPDTYYLPKPLDSEKLTQLLTSVLARPAAHPPGRDSAQRPANQRAGLP